jgi:hypothetical protein
MNYASETSLGVVTIRAFNMVDRFFQNYLKLIDTDAGLFFYSNATMEWLILRIEVLQNLTLFTAALLLVLLPKGVIAPGNIIRIALFVVARNFQTLKILIIIPSFLDGLQGLWGFLFLMRCQ